MPTIGLAVGEVVQDIERAGQRAETGYAAGDGLDVPERQGRGGEEERGCDECVLRPLLGADQGKDRHRVHVVLKLISRYIRQEYYPI